MTAPSFPGTRMRRNRKQAFSRKLVREVRPSIDDLIWPLFISPHEGKHQISSMPGVYQHGPEALLAAVEEAKRLKIQAIVLFPALGDDAKSEKGDESWNPDGLVQQTIRRIKAQEPELGVITDVALDPYTLSGQDGLTDASNYVLNDETVEVLVRQALSHAEAGADIVAPSDMMDGRIGAIRGALESADYIHTQILAYSAKYSSSFYGPFRDAVGSAKNLAGADKHTYQMDAANSDEALAEVALDVAEGADMVMVKPAMPNLDIIRRVRENTQVPVFAYQVSGEYAMMHAAAANGWLNLDAVMMEAFIGIKRAGAHAVLTYFAPDIARLLAEQD